MSGLEVVGIVASIVQLADIGAKLSVKLCTFYRTVKVANQSLQGLSSDVSLTCSILSELGKTLEQDDQARLCSEQAFCTAQDVLQECRAVFQQIENAIENYHQDDETNRLRRGARKITAVFLGPNLDVLKCNLERLKTTTLLMLHVIMYAGQLRQRKANSTLPDQRSLIQTLIEERTASDQKIEYLNKCLLPVGTCEETKPNHESHRSTSSEQKLASLPLQLREYYSLIRKVLRDIDACQYSLEQSRHLRIRNGIVNVHSAEAVLFQDTYGHAAKQLFDDAFFKFKDVWFPPSGSEVPEMAEVEKESCFASFSGLDPKRSKARLSGTSKEPGCDRDYDRPASIKRLLIPSEVPGGEKDCMVKPVDSYTGDHSSHPSTSSYIYRERERDDYDSPITIKRYVIPSEDRDNRQEFSMSRDDYAGDRELVIRRKTEREEPVTISRYERKIDYEPHRYERGYYKPQETEYDVLRRTDADEDPYYYHSRRTREYHDRRRRRELNPGDSISQASRRREDRDDYSSDDSMVYIRKETTREYNDEHPHHKRHLAEGALVGVGAAELMRSRSKREGTGSHGLGRAARTAGTGAPGAVSVNAAGNVRDYHRRKSPSRHRAGSDGERSRHRHHSRSRSRSHSHSRANNLMEFGLSAGAVASGVAAMRNNKKKDARNRSRARSRSRGRVLKTARSENDDARSESERGPAAAAGLVEHVRSQSEPLKGECSHPQSYMGNAPPILADGLDDKEPVGHKRRRSDDGDACHACCDPDLNSCSTIEERPTMNDDADGKSCQEGAKETSIKKQRRMRSAGRGRCETRATPTPKIATDILVQPSTIWETLNNTGTLETLMLQWTNLTREEILEE